MLWMQLALRRQLYEMLVRTDFIIKILLRRDYRVYLRIRLSAVGQITHNLRLCQVLFIGIALSNFVC